MTLTPREYEVARLFALGWTNERVAHELGIARTTLYDHRSRALAKAGVGSMPELWTRLGWLRIPREPGEVDRLALLALGAIERAEAAIERFNKMRASASDAADLFHPPAEEGSPVVRGFGQCIATTRRPQ